MRPVTCTRCMTKIHSKSQQSHDCVQALTFKLNKAIKEKEYYKSKYESILNYN